MKNRKKSPSKSKVARIGVWKKDFQFYKTFLKHPVIPTYGRTQSILLDF